MKIDKSVQITLVIATAVVLIALIALNNSSPYSGKTVTGQGYSEVQVTPDLIKVYFYIETKADSLATAKEDNIDIYDALVLSLETKGFSEDEIETQSFSVTPNYVWQNGQQRTDGYIATHYIRVEMASNEIEKLSSAIDAGVESGAAISYISFELSRDLESEFKAQALKEASEDARLKAESIAEGLGKNLGSLVSVTDSGFNYYPYVAYGAEGGVATDASTVKEEVSRIVPSEQTVSATVTAVFKLR